MKKDILWIYDENLSDIPNAFAPSYSFGLKYWQYLTLSGDDWLHLREDHEFYTIGILTVLLCLCVEYTDTIGGDRDVFNREDLLIAMKFIENHDPNNLLEIQLKEKVLLGLTIGAEMTTEQLQNPDYEHPRLGEFYDGLQELGTHAILPYFKSKADG